MELFKKYIEQLKDRRADHYTELLLIDRIRLVDVPEWLRRDYHRCFRIYVMAFRIDQSISLERYEEDLLNLDVEISLVQAIGNHILAEKLKRIKNSMEEGLTVFEQPACKCKSDFLSSKYPDIDIWRKKQYHKIKKGK